MLHINNNKALKELINTFLFTAESLQGVTEYITISIDTNGIELKAVDRQRFIYTTALIKRKIFSEFKIDQNHSIDINQEVLCNALKQLDTDNHDSLQLTIDNDSKCLIFNISSDISVQDIRINFTLSDNDLISPGYMDCDAEAEINTSDLLKVNKIAVTENDILSIGIFDKNINFEIKDSNVKYSTFFRYHDESDLSLLVKTSTDASIRLANFNCVLKAALATDRVTISLQDNCPALFKINIGYYACIHYSIVVLEDDEY